MVANHFDTLSFIAEKISSNFLKEVATFLASKGDKKRDDIDKRKKSFSFNSCVQFDRLIEISRLVTKGSI